MENIIDKIKKASQYPLSNSNPCHFEFGIVGETIMPSYINANGKLEMDFILIQNDFNELLSFVEKWYEYACKEEKYILELCF